MSDPRAIPALHRPVRDWVLKAFPRDRGNGVDYLHPQGDPGLFGPDSVTWRIHADFPGMLSGGLCALMLQTLHPRALAAVWDHSNFRADLVGRLRRTTTFVGGTTYAPREAALQMIERVRRIHAGIAGHTEDGLPYAADDPHLLTWVHVTEAYAFLQGFRRYARVTVTTSTADAYYDEVRRIAEALGAQQVPTSEAAVLDYMRRMRPELRFDARSREVLRVLGGIRLPVPAAGLSRELFLHAGAALLPPWAQELMQRSGAQRLKAHVAASTLHAMAPVFRSALRDGVASQSCRRMGRSPESLSTFPASPESSAFYVDRDRSDNGNVRSTR
nr:oxygenase MpaB family protein [Oleiagrimonas soli]